MAAVTPKKVAIIDDEPQICWLVCRILEEEGYLPLVAENGPEGLELVRRERPDVVLLDIRLPGMDGLEVLRQIRAFDRELMVIMLSAFESFEAAVGALKLGSYDFLTKPINIEEMKITLHNAFRTRSLETEVEHLKIQVEQSRAAERIIGDCPAMREVLRQIELASRHNISVMILGESGTGKEIAARAVHALSNRADKPFVCIDGSTIPENLIESELFGYERGSFTGAKTRKLGRLEAANGGTLFLDEIGNMSPGIQMKLLRVLQERTLVRLGGRESIPLDIRLITATHRNLKEAITERDFREDLYYRFNEFPLMLPALRERGDDVLVLTRYFQERFRREFNKGAQDIAPETAACLRRYPWPGNVRELQAAVKRAVILADAVIAPVHLPPEIAGAEAMSRVPAMRPGFSGPGDDIRPIKEVAREVLAEVERDLILRAMERSRGNKIRTAKWLGIDYKTLFNKLKQYAITWPGRNGRLEPMDTADTCAGGRS